MSVQCSEYTIPPTAMEPAAVGFEIAPSVARRWLEASGAMALQRRSDARGSATFAELVASSSSKLPETERISIEKDIARSKVAGLALFDDDAFRSEHSDRIRDVLYVFVADRGDWGYCQGFNFVASALLLLLRGEVELAAWLQDVLYSRFFPSSFFARKPKMSGFHVEVEVLAILIAETFPCIDDALDEGELEMTAQLLGFRWFVPCWTTELRPAVLIAVYDWMLGTERGDDQCCLLNLRLALALFSLCEESLIAEMERLGSSTSAYQHMAKAVTEITDGASVVARARSIRLDPARVASLRFSSEASAAVVDDEVSALSTLTHFRVDQLKDLRAQFEQIADAAAGTASARISGRTLQEVLTRTTPEWPAACTNRLVDILTSQAMRDDGRGGVGKRPRLETAEEAASSRLALPSTGDRHKRDLTPLIQTGGGGLEAGIDFRTMMCALSVLRKGRVEERLRLVFGLFCCDNFQEDGVVKGAAESRMAVTAAEAAAAARGDTEAAGDAAPPVSAADGDDRYLDADGMFALAKTLQKFLPAVDPLLNQKGALRVNHTFSGIGVGGKSLRTRANEAAFMRGSPAMELQMTPGSFVGATLMAGRQVRTTTN